MKTRARFVPALAAGVVLAVTSAGFDLPFVAQMIALGAIVLSILAGIWMPGRPEIRSYAATALAVLAVVAAGQTRAGATFVVLAIAFAIVAVACMRAGRGGVVPTPRHDRAGFVVLVAALVGVPLALALPPSSRWVERRAGALFGRGDADQSGFSARMRLGSTWGMLQSDTVVMRVYPKRGVDVDYLRGAVYDRYERREWTSTLDRTRRAVAASTSLDTADVRIVVARSAPVARWQEARWFLPAGACDLATPSGAVDFDEGAVAHPDAKQWVIAPIAFRTRGCAEAPAAARAPSREDVGLPTKIHAQLQPVADAWTKDAATDRERIEAIVRRLATFEYSLAVKRNFDLDPIVDFLTVHRAGHCEHFASALALLARTRGIPTRVVSGYRVHEENPFDGHRVVRERHAHTWVEAWVDGAWRAYDPTPIVELAPSQRPSLAAQLVDVVRAFVEEVDRKTVALVLAAIGGAFLALRRLVRALRSRREAAASTFVAEAALAPYVALEDALGRAGLARQASEPLEGFAERIASSDAPWAAEVARAIRTYAAFRYGNVGSRSHVEDDLVTTAQTVSSRAPPARAT